MPKASKKKEIVRPKDGTACAKIWAMCDKHKGNRQAVLKECAQRKINPATAVTQYSRWREFTGFVKPKADKASKPAKKVAKKGPPAKKAKVKIPKDTAAGAAPASPVAEAPGA